MRRSSPKDGLRSKQKSETRNTTPPAYHRTRTRRCHQRIRDDLDMSSPKKLVSIEISSRQESTDQLKKSVVANTQRIQPETSFQARIPDGCNDGRKPLDKSSSALQQEFLALRAFIEDGSGMGSIPSLNSESCAPGDYSAHENHIIKHQDVSQDETNSSHGSIMDSDHPFERVTVVSRPETDGSLLPLHPQFAGSDDEFTSTDWHFETSHTARGCEEIKSFASTPPSLERVYSMSVAGSCDLELKHPFWRNDEVGDEFGVDPNSYGCGGVMDIDGTEMAAPFDFGADCDSPDSYSLISESSSAAFSMVHTHKDLWPEDSARRPDEQVDGKSKAVQLRPRLGENGTERAFACPFVKQSPVEHHKCTRFILKRIQDVKQHIFRHHCGPEIYCPVCFAEFERFQDRDDHIRQGGCTRQEIRLLYISDDQKQALRRKFSSSDPEERWMNLWDLIFPGSRRPRSPYVENGQMELISSFRRYCDDKSSDIIVRNLYKAFPKLSTSASTQEFTSVIHRTIHDLLDNFEVASQHR
ncbi:hypothetical protein F5Y18DRAFT_369296 [Xylariaceae sp. FL1019]|nr:hypothetical protein F5Y18DRAFT_369296 [Xylariaceae sp. FL1019]